MNPHTASLLRLVDTTSPIGLERIVDAIGPFPVPGVGTLRIENFHLDQPKLESADEGQRISRIMTSDLVLRDDDATVAQVKMILCRVPHIFDDGSFLWGGNWRAPHALTSHSPGPHGTNGTTYYVSVLGDVLVVGRAARGEPWVVVVPSQKLRAPLDDVVAALSGGIELPDDGDDAEEGHSFEEELAAWDDEPFGDLADDADDEDVLAAIGALDDLDQDTMFRLSPASTTSSRAELRRIVVAVRGALQAPDEVSAVDWLIGGAQGSDSDAERLLVAGHHLGSAIRSGLVAASRLERKALVGAAKGGLELALGIEAGVISDYVQNRVQRMVSGRWGKPARFALITKSNALARNAEGLQVRRMDKFGRYIQRGKAGNALRDIDDSHMGHLCPVETTESEHVGLVRYLVNGSAVDQDGNFAADPDQSGSLGASASLMPFLSHDEAVRAVIGAKNLKQYVPVVGGEPPLVPTGNESVIAAALPGIVRAPEELTVEVGEPSVERTDPWHGATQHFLLEHLTATPKRGGDAWIIPLRQGLRAPDETGIDLGGLYTRPLDNIDDLAHSVGDRGTSGPTVVEKGRIIAHPPEIKLDVAGEPLFCPGVNCLVAFMPFFGYNTEDAIVVSRSLAEKFTSSHIVRLEELMSPSEDVDRSPNGMLGHHLADERLFGVVRRHGEDAKRPVRTINLPEAGTVIGVEITRGERDDGRVAIDLRVERPLEVGDKMTGRHGNKGVVGLVLDDDRMPHLQDGTPVEMVLNPVGALRRGLFGMLLELHWGWVASTSGRLEVAPPIGHDGKLDELREHLSGVRFVDADGRAQVTFRNPDGNGDKLGARVVVGYQYMLKLDHLARAKEQAQGTARQSVRTGQPMQERPFVAGRKKGRPQRLGEMEFWALQAYRAGLVIRDALGPRRDQDLGLPRPLWRVLDVAHAAGFDATLGGSNGPIATFPLLNLGEILRPEKITSLQLDVAEARRTAGGRAEPSPLLDPPRLRVENANLRNRKDPDARGLYSREIFGGVNRLRCGCQERDPGEAGTICEQCGEEVAVEPGQEYAHAFGYLPLAAPVVNPWLAEEFRTIYLARWAHEQDNAFLPDLADNSVWDSHEAVAKALGGFTGQRKAGEERLAAFLDSQDSDSNDDKRVLNWVSGRASCPYTIVQQVELAEDKGAPWARFLSSWILRYLAVPPLGIRDTYLDTHLRLQRSKLARRYESIAETNARLDEVLAKQADPQRLHGRLAREIDHLFGRIWRYDKRERDTLAELLVHKDGLLRRCLLGSAVMRTGRAVLTPGPSLGIEEVGVPAQIWEELDLAKPGGRVQPVVILNRQPTLHRSNLLALRAVRLDDTEAVRVHPALLPLLAGDYDGDEVTLHRPATAQAATQAWELMRPAASARSSANGRIKYMTDQDLALSDAVSKIEEISLTSLSAQEPVEGDTGMKRLADAYSESFADGVGRASVSIFDVANTGVNSLALQDALTAGMKQRTLESARGPLSLVAGYRHSHEVPGGYLRGLDFEEYVWALRAAYVNLADKKLKTPEAGDLTKNLIEALYDVVVVEADCGTTDRIPDDAVSLESRKRRHSCDAGTEALRSPLTCSHLRNGELATPLGVCAACYGPDLTTGTTVVEGARVGLIAAQSIGERGTQIALKAIHGSGLTPIMAISRLLREGEDWTAEDTPSRLGLVRQLGKLYGAGGDPDRPDIDDVHLELLVAVLHLVFDVHRASGGTSDSPLQVAIDRQPPLARSTIRGNFLPLRDAALDGLRTDLTHAKDALALGWSSPHTMGL